MHQRIPLPDYLALVKEARHLDASKLGKTIRLAVLADFATQQLIVLLRVLAARAGVNLEIYEADYDSIDLEVLNADSPLYAFEPAYVAILVAGEKLKSRFYGTADRAGFAVQAVERLTGLWRVLAENSGATVIQGNYVLPSERAFGHYEQKVGDSLGAAVVAVNHGLAQAAREARNVLLVDVDYLAADVGRRAWFDPGLWVMAKGLCALDHLPGVAQAVLDVVLAAAGRFVKCVILDLDNTLWGGVIGDDGVSGIVLGDYDEGEAFVAWQKFIKDLKRRGIILAVVSKNDHANAVLPFNKHPHMILKETDISIFIANWDNKADNIRQVQKVLNIGFDSMVFLDDNPYERNLVREFLPDVIVPELPEDPAQYLAYIAGINLFETASFSEADRKRGEQYREEAQRELTKTQFTNISDYLASLEMEIRLERFVAFNLPRIAQLIQRSNQFNLCTRRYGEAACESFMRDVSIVPFTLMLKDKFGDYGLIAVIVLKVSGEDLEIDEYLMSCRVLKRGVEQFAMNQIFELARARGLRRVVGRYLKTDKNDMVKGFFADFEFEKIEEDGAGNTIWALDVETYAPCEVFLTTVVNEIRDSHQGVVA